MAIRTRSRGASGICFPVEHELEARTATGRGIDGELRFSDTGPLFDNRGPYCDLKVRSSNACRLPHVDEAPLSGRDPQRSGSPIAATKCCRHLSVVRVSRGLRQRWGGRRGAGFELVLELPNDRLWIQTDLASVSTSESAAHETRGKPPEVLSFGRVQ
jgi:hypothetical protein